MRLDGFCRRNAGYLVVLGTMWITTSNFAFLRSASVLYTAFLEQYRCSYAEATWTFTLVGGVGSLTTLLAGFLVHYTSVRLVCSVGIVICSVSIWLSSLATSIRQIILLGAVQGFGVGLYIGLLPVIIAQHFDKGRSTACGLCYTGCTLSAVVFPRLLQEMLLVTSISRCLQLLAVVSALGLLGALLLQPPAPANLRPPQVAGSRQPTSHGVPLETCITSSGVVSASGAANGQVPGLPHKPEDGHAVGNQLDCETVLALPNGAAQAAMPCARSKQPAGVLARIRQDLRLLRNPYFQLVSLLYVTYIFTYLVYFIVLQAFAEERGLSRLRANALIMWFSAGDLTGRLLPGLLHLRGLLSNKQMYVGSMLALGGSFCAMPALATGQTSFTLLVMLSGLMNGVQMTQPAVVMSEYLGVANTAMGFGFANFISGVTALFRPALIDYIKSSSGLYDRVFYVIGVLCLASALPWLAEPWLRPAPVQKSAAL